MRVFRIGLQLLGWLALLISIVALGATIYLWVEKESGRRQLAEVRHELTEEGILKPIAELVPPPPREAAANGQKFLAAIEPLAALAQADPEIFNGPEVMRLISPESVVPLAELTVPIYPGSPNPKNPQTWEELRARLAPGRPIATAAAVILQGPVAFDYDYASLTATLPFGESQRLMAWLRASAILEIHRGDISAALHHMSVLDQVITRVGERYTLVDQTISMGMWYYGLVGASWEVLQSATLTEADLLRLRTIAERQRFAVGFLRISEMDVATVHDYFLEYQKTGPSLWDSVASPGPDILDSESVEAVRALLWRQVWVKGDEVRMLRQNAEMLQIMRDFVKRQNLVQLRATFSNESSPSTFDRWRFPISTSEAFRHVYLGVTKSIAFTESTRELILAAIALKRYHLHHGRYPDTLAALVPDYLPQPPHDWFDGQPLKYRLDESGQYILYSAGPDGLDNGGDPSPVKELPKGVYNMSNGRDLVWPRAAKSRP